MNTTSNSVLGRAARGAALLGLCALALAGCSDHGPVGIYSQELFHKSVAAPQLVYYAASSLTFTTSTNIGTSPQTATIQPLIVIVNSGGSGTYGPVQATFSSTDPNLIFEAGNQGGAWTSDSQDAPPGVATAVSQQGAGSEILGLSQTQVALYQGYDDAGASELVNDYFSFNAYYKPNMEEPANDIVPVVLTMTDGIGNKYSSTFDLTITQDNP